jgi:hypothetical protein
MDLNGVNYNANGQMTRQTAVAAYGGNGIDLSYNFTAGVNDGRVQSALPPHSMPVHREH